jgi:hypothetical protein
VIQQLDITDDVTSMLDVVAAEATAQNLLSSAKA